MTDKEKAPIEIERKFLIRFPDVEVLQKQEGVRIKKMRQTYLRAENGITARVRAVTENGKTRYVHTEKSRISDLSAIEREREVSEPEYQKLMKNADPERKTIEKTRYACRSVIMSPKSICILFGMTAPFWRSSLPPRTSNARFRRMLRSLRK